MTFTILIDLREMQSAFLLMNIPRLSLEVVFKIDANDNLFNGCVQKQKLPSLHWSCVRV